MKIRLYLDEDSMDRDLVRALRARGVDVLSALEAGMVDRPDPEHLDYAALHGRAIYSFNIRDYHQLHTEYLTQGRSHAGILLSRQQQYSVGEQMRRLLPSLTPTSSYVGGGAGGNCAEGDAVVKGIGLRFQPGVVYRVASRLASAELARPA